MKDTPLERTSLKPETFVQVIKSLGYKIGNTGTQITIAGIKIKTADQVRTDYGNLLKEAEIALRQPRN